MPVRDLTILFQIIDKASRILDPLLNKLDEIDGKEIAASVSVDADTSGATALEGALASLDQANQKVAGSLEKVAGSADKEGKKAEEAGKKTKASGEAAKQATGLYGQLQKTLDQTASKFETLADKIDPIKGKLLALQATVMGLATMAVYSTAKTESLVEELKGLKGESYSAPLIEWAQQGKNLDYTSKGQRLTIATDLSDLDYSTDEVKKYGEEIEKFFFQKTGQMKRYGIQSAAELAQALSTAEKTGNVRGIERLFSSGAISEEKLNKETERLRLNYEKYAFATDEVVKKQAMHNLMMKELEKTNKSFTGQAVTLEQKLGVLQDKFSGLLSGIGDKLEPVFKSAVDGLIQVIDTIESIPGHDQILVFVGALVVALTGLLTLAGALAPVVFTLSSLAGAAAGLGGALGGVIGILTTVVGAVGALAGGLASLPFLPVIAALALIAGALYLLYTRTTVLQDGFGKLSDLVTKAQAAVQKLWTLVSGGLKGNKTEIQDLGAWVKNFLEGLIPGWLSDIFAKGQSIYREVWGWFDRIMGWWNSFLEKVSQTYDKVKDFLGLGGSESGSQATPEMQQYGVTGYGSVNGAKAVKVQYHELPSSQWSTPVYEQIKAAAPGGKTRLYGQEWIDFQKAHPDLAAAMTGSGEILIPMEDLKDYPIPEAALPPEPTTLPDIARDKALDLQDAITEPGREAAAAVQQSGDTYVDQSAQTYKETYEKTGSETAAGLAAYDPVGFYKDLGGKGANYLGEKTKGLQDWVGGLGKGAEGATVQTSGPMIVHQNEELIPARITSGVGKLGSLLEAALGFMNGRADVEREISERVFSQQQSSTIRSMNAGPISVTINAPVTVQVSRDVDLSKLDVNRLIDWNKVSYELEKIVRNTFRFQEG